MQTVKSSHILKHRDIERIPDIKDILLRSSISNLVTIILEVGLFNITERPISNLGGKVEETEVIVTGYVLTPEEHTESLQLLKDLRESIPENKQKSVKRLIELLIDQYGNSI